MEAFSLCTQGTPYEGPGVLPRAQESGQLALRFCLGVHLGSLGVSACPSGDSANSAMLLAWHPCQSYYGHRNDKGICEECGKAGMQGEDVHGMPTCLAGQEEGEAGGGAAHAGLLCLRRHWLW
eukprot:1144412-Pelagomonas_calceolata.AAC.4